MPQTIVPASTFENPGGWTITGAATAHQAIDETIAAADDSSSFITCTTTAGIANRIVFILGGAPETGATDPNGTYRIRGRHKRNASSLIQPICYFDLYDSTGTVLFARLTMMSSSHTVWATANFTLSAAEVAAVGTADGDWDSLVAVLFQPGSGSTQAQNVTAIELELPSPLPVLELTRLGAEVFAELPLASAEVTRETVEVIGSIPTPRLSRIFGEAIGSYPSVRVTRSGLEAIASIPTPFVTRLGAEAFSIRELADALVTRASGEVIGTRGMPRVSRISAEAIGGWSEPQLTRLGAEVFALREISDARVSRAMAEIIASVSLPRVTRAGIEAIASWSEPQLTRFGAEVFAQVEATTPTAHLSRAIAEVIGTRGMPRISRLTTEAIADRAVSGSTIELTRLVAEIWAKTSQENVLHRINCGGSDYLDGAGNTWDADRDFTGGLTFSTADPITNTDKPDLYQSERYGTFSYALPVANGSYTVRLHFAEIFFQASGQRVFSVNINGTQVETDLDLFAEVGHDVAMVRSYGGVSAGGGTGITITGTASVDEAKLSAIEVISSAPASDTAYLSRLAAEVFGTSAAMENDLRFSRIAAEVYAEAQYPVLLTRSAGEVIGTRGMPRVSRVIAEAIAEVTTLDQLYLSRIGAELWAKSATPEVIAHHRIRSGYLGAYTDSLGQDWDADRDYVGPTDVFATPDAITGTDEGPLYQDERFGVGSLWGYVLEVPGPGTYRVRVHLAEIYHKADGMRLFDIEINGVTFEAGIDIHAAVGHDVALVKEYVVEVGAGAASTITVYFRATVDAGKCSAIEVLQDSVVQPLELTRLGAEVFGKRTETLLTRVGAEAIASTIQDYVLLTRAGSEVIAQADQGRVNLSRVVAEVCSSDVRYARLTRLMAEVISTGRIPMNLTRLAAEVFGFEAKDQVRLTRLAAEVFGANPNPIRLTRVAAEVFSKWIESNDSVFATRVGAEIFARIFGQTPFSPLELVASDLFIANWRDEVVVDTTWSTDITASGEGLAEDRISLVDRPYRTEEVTLTGLDIDQANRLITLANRHGQGRLTVPLYCDFSRVTAPSGGTIVFCPTEHRRFFAGGRILIHGWTQEATRRPGGAEYALIDQVTPSGLVLQESLSSVFDRGARVYPVMDTELQLTSEIAVITDEIAELALRVSEVIGQSALPPTVTPGALPPGFPTHENEPILVSRPDWTSRIFVRPTREGDQTEIGRGLLTRHRGAKPRIEYSAQYVGLRRPDSWSLVQFLDSRAGRTEDFWFVAHDAMYSLLEAGTFHLDVRPINASVLDQQAFYSFIALKLRSGTVLIRRIAEFREIDPGRWRIDVDQALPSISLEQVHRVTSGHHVRFVADLMRERWSSDERCKVTLGLIDLLEEGDVSVPIPDPPTDYQGIGEIENLHLWVDASKGLFNGQKIGSRFNYPIPSGWYITAWDDARHEPNQSTSSDPCLFGRHPQDTLSPRAWELSPSINGGRRAAYSLTSAPFTETRLHLMTGNTHAEISPGDSLDLPYWDNDLGLTLIWCGRIAGKKTGTSFIRSYGSHDWNYTQLKLYATKGVDNPPSWAEYDDVSEFEDLQILMARWSPAFSLRVWQHGNPIGQAIVSPGNLTAEVDGHGGSEPSSIVCCELGEGSFTSAFLIFKRSLAMSEMNAIGRILSKRYGAPWTDILN